MRRLPCSGSDTEVTRTTGRGEESVRWGEMEIMVAVLEVCVTNGVELMIIHLERYAREDGRYSGVT